ncbi:MAG: Fpg/Nei family DNA glycosylase [Sedimentisphaerales bacterium]
MPELPDVQTYKRYVDATSLHQQIQTVTVRNRRILRGISANKLKSKLQKRCFQSTTRHGKYLFVKTDNNRWLTLHFGMTGFLKYFKNDKKSGPHDRLIIAFENGYNLAYVCQRLLGTLRLITSVDNFISDIRLGPDALNVDFEQFKKILQESRGAIKSTLMNQKRLAGIGNIYSDEILFQSNVHPETISSKLNHEQIRKIYHNMGKVLKKAIERQANPNKLPNSYLLPHRQKLNRCPRCNGILKTTKVMGRTAYFCPNCQRNKTG